MGIFAQTAEVTTIEITTTSEGSLAALGVIWLLWVALLVAFVVAMWKMFEKAEEPGWKAIIPIYNTYTLFRIAGRNGWWFLGLFVPILGLAVSVILAIDLAKHFGKSTVFGVFGLFIFSIVGYMMLGFGDAKYVGTKHQ